MRLGVGLSGEPLDGGFAQAQRIVQLPGGVAEKPDHRHRRLLRLRDKRPRCRAAKRTNEFSPPDEACHVTLRWGVMPMQWGTIPRFNRAVCDTSR
jgi:hypothetical protein